MVKIKLNYNFCATIEHNVVISTIDEKLCSHGCTYVSSDGCCQLFYERLFSKGDMCMRCNQCLTYFEGVNKSE